MRERYARYEVIKANEQRAEEYRTEDADLIVVAYGASSRVARSAVNKAREEGLKVGLVRPITLWPFRRTRSSARQSRRSSSSLWR